MPSTTVTAKSAVRNIAGKPRIVAAVLGMSALAGCSMVQGTGAQAQQPPKAATTTAPTVTVVAQNPVAAKAATRWVLTWNSNFSKPGTLSKWIYFNGGTGWGLKQLQYYDRQNAAVNKQGQLVITMSKAGSKLKCWYGPCKYTSARMETLNKFSQTYGKFEAKIKFPAGHGLWPAFWMEGTNIYQAGWPAAGEIDGVEPFNRNTHLVLGYAHSAKVKYRARLTVPHPTTAGFHTYGVVWNPKGITWYFDGHAYGHMNATKNWGFSHRFFIILNLAIGGNYPGPISKSIHFPAQMIVDWVKVYRQA